MKKILFIHPEGNAWHNPTLYSLIHKLVEIGYSVDILCRRSKIGRRKTIEGLRWIEDNIFLWALKAISINKLCLNSLCKIISLIDNLRLKANKYSFIIGVDRQGLIESSYLSQIAGVRYGLISFEIMFFSETSKRFKKLEIDACVNCEFWVTQDENRARCLKEENGLRDENKLIVPIGTYIKPKPIETSGRLRDALKIPEDKKVAILMGSLSKWTMAPEIINSLKSWPSNWVLLLHHRYGNAERELDKISSDWRLLQNNRLYISDYEAEDFSAMGYVLNGIDCGIALYMPLPGHRYLGKNIENIGMSSGKVSEYLRNGVPVITNIAGDMALKVKCYTLGAVTIDVSELPLALTRFQSRNIDAIKAAYNEIYVKNSAFDSIISVMKSATQH